VIFIGGIGPRKKRLESHPRICPGCGLAQAYLVRSDDYLSLFFVPILRIRKGRPMIQCERCGHTSDENGRAYSTGMDLRARRCTRCGTSLESDFHYCPQCGRAL
jgi:predicted RNA-binding Zn-ribbon protein involved in translation (DUF1610 family)